MLKFTTECYLNKWTFKCYNIRLSPNNMNYHIMIRSQCTHNAWTQTMHTWTHACIHTQHTHTHRRTHMHVHTHNTQHTLGMKQYDSAYIDIL